MRLADFIVLHIEPILADWEAFAANELPSAANMNAPALRDHASGIIQAIVLDLNTSEHLPGEDQKTDRHPPRPPRVTDTATQTHALLRAQGGFSITQLATEYRVLRASVLRLWREAARQANLDLLATMADMPRFNEAIDQALIESIAFFSQEVERGRRLFLGIVGHDLRSPLNTILMNSTLLSKARIEVGASEAVGRIVRSGARIKILLDDLLDFNRAALGKGLQLALAEVDLAQACSLEIDSIRSAHADRVIRLHLDGDLHGVYDQSRIQQLLANLVKNALEHGAKDAAVEVSASATDVAILLAVHNRGPGIAAETIAHMFEPLVRGGGEHDSPTPNTNLGLGLFIAREIAKAHGGDIQVKSGEAETTFTVCLPRRAR